MKAQNFRLGIASALAASVMLAGVVSAQDANTNTNTTRRAQRRGPAVEQRLERMATELKLNEDQKAKVKGLFEKQAKQRREIFSDTALSRDEQRQKMRTVNQDENKELKTILTSEQFEKWQKLREEMRARGPRNRGEPGGSTAAPAPEPKNPDKAQ